jgi:hypothetical protein
MIVKEILMRLSEQSRISSVFKEANRKFIVIVPLDKAFKPFAHVKKESTDVIL